MVLMRLGEAQLTNSIVICKKHPVRCIAHTNSPRLMFFLKGILRKVRVDCIFELRYTRKTRYAYSAITIQMRGCVKHVMCGL